MVDEHNFEQLPRYLRSSDSKRRLADDVPTLSGDLDEDFFRVAAVVEEVDTDVLAAAASAPLPLSELSTCGFSLRFVTASLRELMLSPRSAERYSELLELSFLLQQMLSIQSYCEDGEEVVRVLRAIQVLLLDVEQDRKDGGTVKLDKPRLQQVMRRLQGSRDMCVCMRVRMGICRVELMAVGPCAPAPRYRMLNGNAVVSLQIRDVLVVPVTLSVVDFFFTGCDEVSSMKRRPCLKPHSRNQLEVMACLCTVVDMILDVAVDERLTVFSSMVTAADGGPLDFAALMASLELFPPQGSVQPLFTKSPRQVANFTVTIINLLQYVRLCASLVVCSFGVGDPVTGRAFCTPQVPRLPPSS